MRRNTPFEKRLTEEMKDPEFAAEFHQARGGLTMADHARFYRRCAAAWKKLARKLDYMSTAGWQEVGLAWDERYEANLRAKELAEFILHWQASGAEPAGAIDAANNTLDFFGRAYPSKSR